MAYNPQFVPQPLGQVTVPSPGTPVQIVKNFLTSNPVIFDPATGPPGSVHIPCNKININASTITQGGAGNTGKVYIGQQTMNKTTLAGVIAVISPGGGLSITNNVSLNIYDANLWYVDADTANDGIYGSIDTV